jgi:hypothetical protein
VIGVEPNGRGGPVLPFRLPIRWETRVGPRRGTDNDDVDEGVALDDAQLDALRRRVYQRGAPPEAAREYAAALAVRAVIPAPQVAAVAETGPSEPAQLGEPAGAGRRRASGGPLAALLAVVVLAAVLIPHSPGAARRPGPTPMAASASAAAPLEAPSIPGSVLATLSNVRSRTSARLNAHGYVVILASLCNGDGTVTIHVSDGSTTVLACSAGMPALAMVQTAKALGSFTVTTTSDGHPRWTMTVGALDPWVS